MTEVQPRHGGEHHYVNVKYGYIVFGITIVQIAYLIIFKFVYIQQWKRSGLYNGKLSFLANPPTWLIILIWSVIIVILGQSHISEFLENYTTVAKRLGRLAYALIPLNIYLILRFPNAFNWNCGYYLQNLNLHKWLSRLIFILSLVHAAGFTYKWIHQGTLVKFVKFWNFLGIVVLVPFIILIPLSIRLMRRKWYSGFYITHNITAWLMVVLITLHARPGVLFFAITSLVLLAMQLYLRFIAAYKINSEGSLKIINVPSSSLQIVKIPLPTQNFPVWSPGSHIRINYSYANIKSWIGPTHPFTLSSTYEDQNKFLLLIMKKTANFQFKPEKTYLLTGPYPALPAPFFSTLQVVNILCGGSGISFGLPLFQYFKSTSPNTVINLVWSVRNKADLFIRNSVDLTDVQVYVTSTIDEVETDENVNSTQFVVEDEHDEENYGLLDNDNNDNNNNEEEVEEEEQQQEGIELHTLHKQSSGTDASTTSKEGTKLLKVGENYWLGRPKLDEVFALHNPTLTHDPKCSWVVACGPDGLIKDAKTWAKDHNYQFFSEKYEM